MFQKWQYPGPHPSPPNSQTNRKGTHSNNIIFIFSQPTADVFYDALQLFGIRFEFDSAVDYEIAAAHEPLLVHLVQTLEIVQRNALLLRSVTEPDSLLASLGVGPQVNVSMNRREFVKRAEVVVKLNV
jgi:hypothetical protein